MYLMKLYVPINHVRTTTFLLLADHDFYLGMQQQIDQVRQRLCAFFPVSFNRSDDTKRQQWKHWQ